MTKLSEEQRQSALCDIPEWSEVGEALQRTYVLADFDAALEFVNRVAEIAKQDDHHPDILIRYNKVTLTLTTHDAGGITDKDFAQARAIDGFVPAQA